MSGPVLTLARVRKSFGGVRALGDASLALYPGRVTALAGENGAGKSTLVKILSGVEQPDAGEIELDGRRVVIRDARQARALGIGVVHQDCVIFDNLSVAENIFLTERPTRRGFIDWEAMRRRAAATLAELEAEFDPDMPAGSLSIAQKHLVQIARALNFRARILILDEPTAALSQREAGHLLDIVRRLAASGTAVLFISHRLEEIFTVADDYVVFRDGAAVGQGAIAETSREQVIRMMVGRTVEPAAPVHPSGMEREVLRVTGLTRTNEFADISLTVNAGEIVGLYGLVGAGRSELAECLFGLTRADAGEVLLDGRRLAIRSPRAALRAGIAYVPEGRQTQGAILPFSIAANVSLANLERVSRRGWYVPQRACELAREWIARLGIVSRDPQQRLAELSGGNQQKVVLARWLAREPRLLILDEPTKGIDIAAKAAVHAVAAEVARRGAGVLMISSDLTEVLGIAHRILVMRRGRLRAVLDRGTATPEAVVRAATDA